MKRPFEVKVRYMTYGWTEVEAETSDEALALVMDGQYEDIYGVYSEIPEAVSAEAVPTDDEED